MIIDVYVHSTKDYMLEKGIKHGLKGKALDFFMCACYEVKLTLDVDEETGDSTVIKVDGREIKQ